MDPSQEGTIHCPHLQFIQWRLALSGPWGSQAVKKDNTRMNSTAFAMVAWASNLFGLKLTRYLGLWSGFADEALPPRH